MAYVVMAYIVMAYVERVARGVTRFGACAWVRGARTGGSEQQGHISYGILVMAY